jgi:hypothetical protein
MFPKPKKHRQCGQSKNCFFSINPAPFDLHQTSLSSFRQCGQIGHTSSGASTRSIFFCVVINSSGRCRQTTQAQRVLPHGVFPDGQGPREAWMASACARPRMRCCGRVQTLRCSAWLGRSAVMDGAGEIERALIYSDQAPTLCVETIDHRQWLLSGFPRFGRHDDRRADNFVFQTSGMGCRTSEREQRDHGSSEPASEF